MPRARSPFSLVLAALLIIPASATVAQEPDASPIVLEPEPGSLVHGLEAHPGASVIDAMPTAWERLEIGPDGRSVRVVFWSGVPECYGLDRVDVHRSGSVPVITVWTGRLAEAEGEACIDLAQLYHADVLLEEPLVTAGTTLEPPAPAAIGPGIGIDQVDEAPAGEILLINGSLRIGRDGTVRLWEDISESEPPKGVGRSLLVKGLDEDTIDWSEADGVRWSKDVQLLGHVRDGTLTVARTAL